MSTQRETIVRIDGQGVDGGAASLMVYRLGDRVEVVTTEEENGEASVVLTLGKARHLSEALAKSVS